MSTIELWRLFHPELTIRAAALRALSEATAHGEAMAGATCYALRDVLLGDERAAQRAAAARLLGAAISRRSASRRREAHQAGADAPSDAEIGAWLALGLDDEAASVRDAVCGALARMAAPEGRAQLPRLEAVCLGDRSWSVRRSAVRARVALTPPAQREAVHACVALLRAV
ncbi:MAG: hypothetical protein KC503_20335, partial [Myxococcales bacterium]|nr:hypothetical protein [Myxococcales bacterium]